MDDFTSKLGVPNCFGLIQGPANAIAPGKRPLSAMTPTIVARSTASSRYGPRLARRPTIITTVANVLISIVDNGLNIQQAADAPRFHHQYLPDMLHVETGFPADTAALAAEGYTLKQGGHWVTANASPWTRKPANSPAARTTAATTAKRPATDLRPCHRRSRGAAARSQQ